MTLHKSRQNLRSILTPKPADAYCQPLAWRSCGGQALSLPAYPTLAQAPSYQTHDPYMQESTAEGVLRRTSYRKRNLIERKIGWFKECRALGTRHQKLAVDHVTL